MCTPAPFLLAEKRERCVCSMAHSTWQEACTHATWAACISRLVHMTCQFTHREVFRGHCLGGEAMQA